ncbi:MAG TPA: mannose-1-phosphate guanylyltransferase [Candidatus Acidoferrales bacterium]|nr:mannose-1-phosphate guanylyltransferase [Candidatus Acidoferrales bacterium]
MKVFALIMAGGIGSRIWPKSREATPKQFQNIFGSRTLYQRAYDRISKIVPPQNIFVVTNQIHCSVAAEQITEIPKRNIIGEPVGRSTAPCIAAAASAISSITDNAVMVVLPSDHLISQEENYINQMKEAIRLAEKHRALVTIGIRPTYPETGYGYIQFNKNEENSDITVHGGHRVIAFKEKPDSATAVKFLESGDYLWNSGMFIWRIDVILEELKKNLEHFSDFDPQMKESYGQASFAAVVNDFYSRVKSISIDYAVMEKSDNVLTIPSNFSWSDVGSWDEIYRLSDVDSSGNAFKGNVVSVRSRNNLVWADDKVVTIVEAEDLVVVETKDSILICKKGKSQSVKDVVDILRKQGRQDLL